MPSSYDVVLLDDGNVNQILGIEESHFFDLKGVEIQPSKLTETISAFANASGGEIYVGIEEVVGETGKERHWKGFADQEAANGLIQTIESLSPLANHFSLLFLSNEKCEGVVVHLTIFKTKNIVSATNGKIYVRRGAQKLPVEGEIAIRRLKLDKGLVSFEDDTVTLDTTELTNTTKTIEFMITEVPTAEPEVWLRKQQVILGDKCTVAGVLLFHELPQSILPKRSSIKILQYKTKSEGERDTLAFTPITIEGPLYDLIYDAVYKCREIVESIEKLGETGLKKITYPDEALHEIITNAVLHRDYSIAVDVQVRIFDNRIEIESPGKLAGHVTTQNILHEQSARNPKIVRLINKFPDPPNKDVGEGLNTTFQAMEKLRLKPPIIEERDNSVIVILRHESLDSPEQIVMEYLNSHGEISNSIARDLTGIRSENTMKNVFYRLRDKRLLEQVQGKVGRNATWKKK